MDPIKLQRDLRNNQEDIQDYMRDLRNWTDQIKKKDKELSSQTKAEKLTESVRVKDRGDSKRSDAPEGSSSSGDDKSQRKKMAKKCDPSEEVLKLKEAGNECLRNKKYEEAINHYSAAMNLEPNYHILPANRGMAYLKLNSFEKAEEDCSRSVALDPEYIKGYLRRGTARWELGKLQQARDDYQKVLKLEPHNPQAKMSLERIKLEEAKQTRLKTEKTKSEQPASGNARSSRTVVPSKINEKPVHLRSKKSLKRIPIVQVLNNDELKTFIEESHLRRVKDVTEPHSNGTAQLSQVNAKKAQDATNDVSRSGTGRMLLTDSTEAEGAGNCKEEKTTTKGNDLPATSVSNVAVALPLVPRSSYEFVRDWKLLRGESGLRGQYLRRIPPASYAAIFKQSLEESTLVGILRVAESLPAAEVGAQLRGLSQVQRVDVLVMFMASEDRRLLRSLVDRCETDGQDMTDVRKRIGV